MSRRWIVIGPTGQLGSALVRRLGATPGHELAAALGRSVLDLRRVARIPEVLGPEVARADVVVNAAAYTDVDGCETAAEECHLVNAEAPGRIARACRNHGVPLVHVSTDYVFDGQGSTPYREDDPPAPRSVYGRSKLEGECRVLEACPEALVVRTSWLYGAGRNFVATIFAHAARVLAGEIPELRVVDDQTGRPTYAEDLAGGIVALVEASCQGLYHLANSGLATWWELARAALDHVGHADLPVARVSTAEFPRPAPRPAWSVLDLEKAARAGVSLRPWREALAAYLDSEAGPRRPDDTKGAT